MTEFEQCIPDAMHNIKDVMEHAVKLICGEEDGIKVRRNGGGVRKVSRVLDQRK